MDAIHPLTDFKPETSEDFRLYFERQVERSLSLYLWVYKWIVNFILNAYFNSNKKDKEKFTVFISLVIADL